MTQEAILSQLGLIPNVALTDQLERIEKNTHGFEKIIHRFERKGLLIAGMKMMSLDDAVVTAHYFKYKDKPFFAELANYMKEYPVEKMARDAKITQIYEGTNQIQRNQIGLSLIKEAAQKK